MSHQYEIEIKSLLGEKDRANELRAKIAERGGELLSEHKQLNHYFTSDESCDLETGLCDHITPEKLEAFKNILNDGKDFSIRTREADGKVIFVTKASIGDDSSSNGVSRMEFEDDMDMTLEELDQILLDAGLQYQAKWSREREEYALDDGKIHVCLDRNAGYGHLAEFETIVDSADEAEKAKTDLYALMEELGAEELEQDRLERMFAHYNDNWEDYYGTDKVFVIE